jgi:excinuclease UvrABC nuclease subunit
MKNKKELIALEKELIHRYQPKLNISHKYKVSNKTF